MANLSNDLEYTTALFIVKTSIFGTEEVEKVLKEDKIIKRKITSDLYTRLSLEFMYLLIFLSDLTCYQLKGSKKRSKFINSVVHHIAIFTSKDQIGQFGKRFKSRMTGGEKDNNPINIQDNDINEMAKFASQVEFPSFDIEELNERLVKYSGYKLFPNENEATEGTLFWEFGEYMSHIACGERTNFLIIMTFINIAMSGFKYLPILQE